MRVLDYAKGFWREHTGQSFGGWLRTITRSRVAEHGRKQARQPLGRGGTDGRSNSRNWPRRRIPRTAVRRTRLVRDPRCPGPDSAGIPAADLGSLSPHVLRWPVRGRRRPSAGHGQTHRASSQVPCPEAIAEGVGGSPQAVEQTSGEPRNTRNTRKELTARGGGPESAQSRADKTAAWSEALARKSTAEKCSLEGTRFSFIFLPSIFCPSSLVEQKKDKQSPRLVADSRRSSPNPSIPPRFFREFRVFRGCPCFRPRGAPRYLG